MTPRPTLASVATLLRTGDPHGASRDLLALALDGNPAALLELARWRIVGTVVTRDLARAREGLRRAALAGSAEAALLRANFLAAGLGGPADGQEALATVRALAPHDEAAAAQLAVLDAPAIPFRRKPLSASPHVERLSAFLSDAECDHVVAIGSAHLRRSVVVDPKSGHMVEHPVRRSDAAIFGVFAEDVVVNRINRRIAGATGTAYEAGEPLQLLRYGPSDEYRSHLDTLPGEPNQRIVTLIAYLNDEYEGGETAFPEAGLTVRGRKGDALLFRNVDAAGRPDPRTRHAGLPVRSGTKLIASRWIRATRFTYPAPVPLVAM